MKLSSFFPSILTAMLALYILNSAVSAQQAISEQTQVEIGREYLALLQTLPENSQLLTSVYPHALSVYGTDSRMVENNGVVGQQAFEVAVLQPSQAASDQGANLPTIGEIQRGDLLCLTFWARGKATGFDEGPAVLEGVGVQKAKKPYTTLVNKKVTLRSEWQQFSFNTIAPKKYKAGQAQVFFHFGSHRQLIQLGPVMLFNLGIERPNGESRACGRF